MLVDILQIFDVCILSIVNLSQPLSKGGINMEILNYRVALPTWVFRRKTEVMYLVIGPDGLKKYRDIIDIGINEQLGEVVGKYLNAHINEGATPPQEIAPTILNIADDVLSGRSPTLRAGDYIALQQFIRQGAK
ncbi:MAG: hypothetical protein E3K37_00270 [Candidatus Kuenenia sp.]|nr:hypothetical protein [Candidatus Kuenenia hertensis]